MINLERSELASMYTEAMNQLDGLEIRSYVSTLMGLTGDEPQCLPTTHSSMYQLWSGDTTPDHVSSLIRYQWDERFEELKSATPLQNWPPIIPSPQRAMLFTPLTDYQYSRRKLKKSLPTTAPMMYFCARRYSNDLLKATLRKSYGSST